MVRAGSAPSAFKARAIHFSLTFFSRSNSLNRRSLRQLQDRPAYNKNPGQPQYINRRTATSAIREFHRLLSEFLPAFLNPRARRVFALIFSEHLRQVTDSVKIAILVRFIFVFPYTRIRIIRARTWYCFNPCQLARIPIVTNRTEMLFLWQNFIRKISYTPISKNPAKIRMLASHRKSQNAPQIKHGHTSSDTPRNAGRMSKQKNGPRTRGRSSDNATTLRNSQERQQLPRQRRRQHTELNL